MTKRPQDRPILRTGQQLSPLTQRMALGTFTNRYTREHVPAWVHEAAAKGRRYPVQFDSDVEWLERTKFAVTLAGHLDRREAHCQSFPTWPDNPEMRARARKVA
jgi:hypothetical protein